MRKMKDSGIAWIGEIPQEWEIKRIKYEVNFINGFAFNSDLFLDSGKYVVVRIGDIQDNYLSRDNLVFYNDIDDNIAKQFIVRNNDILIAMSGATIGKLCLVKDIIKLNVLINQRVGIIRSGIYKYVYYSLLTENFLAYLYLMNASSAQPNISSGLVLNYSLALPPLPEQQAIADKLDKVCGEIDKVIAKTKAVVEEYKKLKQAIITEAVTGKKQCVMRNSQCGIKGKWAEIKLKWVADIYRGGSPRPIEDYMTLDDNGYNWIKIGDTIKGEKYITHAKEKIIKEGLLSTRYVEAGNLLLTNSMSFGEPYILAINGCIHDGWLAFSSLSKVDKEFLYYFLISDYCRDQFMENASGGIVLNLNIEKVKNTHILLPPLPEQQAIVAYLDTKCGAIDEVIAKKQQLITEMENYKKSVIYEYVTGKKEVG